MNQDNFMHVASGPIEYQPNQEGIHFLSSAHTYEASLKLVDIALKDLSRDDDVSYTGFHSRLESAHIEAQQEILSSTENILGTMISQQRNRIASDKKLITGLRGELRAQVIISRALGEIATTDKGSRIANRTAFDMYIDTLHSRAIETGEPYALIIIDLNNFKQINDNIGHYRGDTVIEKVGEILSEVVRDDSSDFIVRNRQSSGETNTFEERRAQSSRIGGDEFAVLIPFKTDAANPSNSTTRFEVIGQEILERVKRTLQVGFEEEYDLKDLDFGFAAGVAVYQPGMSLTDIKNLADKAMYEDKQKTYANLKPNKRLKLHSMLNRLFMRIGKNTF